MELTKGSTGIMLFELSHVTSAYYDWLHNPLINRYLDLDPPPDISSLRRTCSAIINNPFSLFFAIYDLPSSTHIGNIKLDNICPKHNTADVGLLVGSESHQKLGHAHRAIDLVMSYAHHHSSLRKITAGVLAPNIPSRKLFLRSGFRHEGLLINHAVFQSQRTDVFLFGYDL